MKNACIIMGDTVGYLIQALVLAKSIRDTQTECDILLLYLPYDLESVKNFSAGSNRGKAEKIKQNRINADNFLEENSTLINELNIQLIRLTEKPYNTAAIKNPNYRNILNQNPTCALDFHKISCWKYEQYSKVLFLDADILVRKNLDHLFDFDYDFMYSDGAASPLNSGVFCLRPDSLVFKDLSQIIHEGNFSYEEGWNNLGRQHKYFNAIEVCQGLFYYYFVKGTKKFKTHKLPRNIYNNQGPQDIFRQQKMPKERYLEQLTSFSDVCIAHFTSWGRLYIKGNEPVWNSPDFGQVKINGKVNDKLKAPFHKEWVDTFLKLEIKGAR